LTSWRWKDTLKEDLKEGAGEMWLGRRWVQWTAGFCVGVVEPSCGLYLGRKLS
jgi:hypothetical protein